MLVEEAEYIQNTFYEIVKELINIFNSKQNKNKESKYIFS